jgi:folate-binding protein YgfZ
VLGLVGPRAAELLAGLGADVAALAPESHVTVALPGGEARVARASDLPDGFVLHALAEAASALCSALTGAGAVCLGPQALDALRVERGLPWYGRDVTEDNLLHETGLVALCHSPSKGCYLGQEVVARLEARGGNVNRALRGLRLEAPVADGAELRVGEDVVGRVTTAALSPRLGPIALAYVHRNHFAPGTRLDAGGVPATVAALPIAG